MNQIEPIEAANYFSYAIRKQACFLQIDDCAEKVGHPPPGTVDF
jgi:hypothetical protein